MKIYLIPGLGYNCRIFEKLKFKNVTVKCLNWIDPKPNEPIEDYAERLFESVPNNEEKIVVIGHSFGGMISQVIATKKRIDKIILLSSIKSRKELPLNFKLVKPFRIYKLFTKEISLRTIKYWGKDHGFTQESEIDLFKSMVGSQSNEYLQWALKSLSIWQTPVVPPSTEIFQIHGTNDGTFPISLMEKPNLIIENGSHIMVYSQAEAMSEILNRVIEKT